MRDVAKCCRTRGIGFEKTGKEFVPLQRYSVTVEEKVTIRRKKLNYNIYNILIYRYIDIVFWCFLAVLDTLGENCNAVTANY